MIKYVEGDILMSKAAAICHGVAPNDDFNQGLAFAVRERWPDLYKDFRHYCHTNSPKSGEVWLWRGVGNFACFSLCTQEGSERHHGHSHPGVASLQNINHSLKELKKQAEKEGFKSIALPRLGCGVGKLAWEEVKTIIEKHFSDSPITVLVYENYAPNKAAKES